MSARCPIKVVFDPDLPITVDEDYFPVAIPTSMLTSAGLAFLNRRAWGRYCLSSKGRDARMKILPLVAVMSSDIFEFLKRGMQDRELHDLGEGLVEGYQVMICDQMSRHDFINGLWVQRSAKDPSNPNYENAQFEDSLILSPDGKTPLIAIRHHRMMCFDLVCCTES